MNESKAVEITAHEGQGSEGTPGHAIARQLAPGRANAGRGVRGDGSGSPSGAAQQAASVGRTDAARVPTRRLREYEVDLAWRFQCGDAACRSIPSGIEVLVATSVGGGAGRRGKVTLGANFTDQQIDAIDRLRRIDKIVGRMLGRHVAALTARFGEDDVPDGIAEVFPEHGAVALATAALESAYVESVGGAASNVGELAEWLEAACRRVCERRATAFDERVLGEIRREVPWLLESAIKTYAQLADEFDRREAGLGRAMKPMLTLVEFAGLIGRSRRTARRFLDEHRIPYSQTRRGVFPRRGTGIRIMLSDLALYMSKLHLSLREAEGVVGRP